MSNRQTESPSGHSRASQLSSFSRHFPSLAFLWKRMVLLCAWPLRHLIEDLGYRGQVGGLDDHGPHPMTPSFPTVSTAAQQVFL